MKNKILLVVSLLVSTLCVFSTAAAAQSEKAKVLATSKKVVSALKNKDMKQLASFVHPTKGVRFSPFAYINKTDDLVFKTDQVIGLLANKKIYDWGQYDESEERIKMTFADYYKKFVYDYDFARPDRVNYNLKNNNGIMINNIAEVYPKGIEVEFFFDGTEKRMYGSLRLIFEKAAARWYLVGIVRDTPGI